MFKSLIIIGNYKIKIIKTISQGAYGFVYLVEDKKKKQMALKKMIAQNQERYDLANKELEFLKNNSNQENPYFIQYFDSKIEKSEKNHIFYILLEFGKNGTLFDLINQKDEKKEKLQEIEILQICKSINQGLHTLHKKNFIHNDIKIENLLFYSLQKIKFCDFGSVNTYNFFFSDLTKDKISIVMEEIEKQTTFMYRPPEMCDVFLNYKIDTKVDMWMLGCVLYTLIFFKHPFVESSKNGIINASFFWKKDKRFSQKLETLVRNLLTPDPAMRLGSKDLIRIMDNWGNVDLKLNPMAMKIKLEHEHIYYRKKKKKLKEDEFFDFTGLNKIGTKKNNFNAQKKNFGKNQKLHKKKLAFNKDFNLFEINKKNNDNFNAFETFDIGNKKKNININNNFDAFETFDSLPINNNKKKINYKKTNPNHRNQNFVNKNNLNFSPNSNSYNLKNNNININKSVKSLNTPNYYSKKINYNNQNKNFGSNNTYIQQNRSNYNNNNYNNYQNQNPKKNNMNSNSNNNSNFFNNFKEDYLSINENDLIKPKYLKNPTNLFNNAFNRSHSENDLMDKKIDFVNKKKKNFNLWNFENNKNNNTDNFSEFKRNFNQNNPLQDNPDFLSF